MTGEEREEQIKLFNAPGALFDVFLISTRAGGLGISLPAANRVILIDLCWNPCHDEEAVVRPYRFGQMKEVYIYRLLTAGMYEEYMFRRQKFKKGLFK